MGKTHFVLINKNEHLCCLPRQQMPIVTLWARCSRRIGHMVTALYYEVDNSSSSLESDNKICTQPSNWELPTVVDFRMDNILRGDIFKRIFEMLHLHQVY